MSRLDGTVDHVDEPADPADDHGRGVDPLALLREPPTHHEHAPKLGLDPEWFRPTRLLGVVAAAAVVVAVGAWLLRPPPPPVEATLPLASPPPAATVATSSSPAELIVHVAGAVGAPGVYTLEERQRVHDAVELAGGATPTADLSRVNLAAPLADGAYVYIPVVGEGPPPAPVLGGAPAEGPVSLNHATAAELETLPGVGSVTAAAIIAHRELVGGF
ncbi:MAG: SLBB domain-containing protein, partial [Acidimicrobiia bacterium]|nr:SLBB domain-containing protein [Acidimicrobiia bacterium]